MTEPGAPSPTDDRALVAACVAGDPEAWHTFIERYRGLVVNVARAALVRAGAPNADALAEDVASEVFADLLARDRAALRNFKAPWSLKGWLGIVTRRRASRVLKGDRKAPTPMEEQGEIAEERRRSVASEVGEVEQAEIVRRHLDELKPRDRLALQLFYEGGRSYQELAEILDLPVNRIGTLLARARKRLARSLGVDA